MLLVWYQFIRQSNLMKQFVFSLFRKSSNVCWQAYLLESQVESNLTCGVCRVEGIAKFDIALFISRVD